MFNKIYLLLFSSLIAFSSMSQSAGFSIGLRTPNEMNLKYSFPLSETFDLGVNASYTAALSDRLGYYGMVFYFTRGLNKKGPGAGFHLRMKAKKEDHFHRFSFEYQQLKSNTFIFDYGAFSGSNESDYEEFKDEYQDLSFNYAFLKSYWNQRIEMYYEFGAHYRVIERKHSVGGQYRDRRPSDKEEEFQRFGATFRLGINFYPFRSK